MCFRRIFPDTSIFNDVFGCVESKAIDPDILKPEANHFLHLCYNSRVAVVQVGHFRYEISVVIFTTTAKSPFGAGCGACTPYIPLAIRGGGVLCLLEPGMLAGGMIEHPINKDANAALMSL